MLQSHVIEVDGLFVGTVVLSVNGYRFVAVAPQLAGISETSVASPQAGRWLAVRALRSILAGAPSRPATESSAG
jgi:hypothetical protein